MIHETHRNGALTELWCAGELIKNGWQVAFPFIQSSPFDLIVFRDNVFRTIQVKSSTRVMHGVAQVVTDFSRYAFCDFVICYDIYNRRWFIFESEEVAKRKSIALSPRKYGRNVDNWNLIR